MRERVARAFELCGPDGRPRVDVEKIGERNLRVDVVSERLQRLVGAIKVDVAWIGGIGKLRVFEDELQKLQPSEQSKNLACLLSQLSSRLGRCIGQKAAEKTDSKLV